MSERQTSLQYKYNTKYNLAHAKSVKLIDDSQARRLGVASNFESPVK